MLEGQGRRTEYVGEGDSASAEGGGQCLCLETSPSDSSIQCHSSNDSILLGLESTVQTGRGGEAT